METPSNTPERKLFPVPDVAEINRISLLADPVNRNLQITACYWDLSAAFARKTGMVANWCSFATWASKQAGVTIRKEDLKRRLEEVLRKEPAVMEILSLISQHARKLGSSEGLKQMQEMALSKLLEVATNRASDAVARGNKKVYEEIGKEFSRFMATCLQDEVYNEATIAGFCKTLKPGPPPDGQEYLCRAFTRYYQAFFETDVKKQLELQFMANIEIGFHEQNRLQPEIAESMNAGLINPEQFRDLLLARIAGQGFLGNVLFSFRHLFDKTTLFKRAVEMLVNIAEKPIRKVITKHLMTITFPPATSLHLGSDLSRPYPESLKMLENAELQHLLASIDPTVNSHLEDDAEDWSDLQQRLRFIADLFRSYQESKELFEAAFTAEQLKLIRTGGIPDGSL
jgi:hypothetical protein